MPGPASAVPVGNVANLFVLSVPIPAGSPFSAPTATTRTYTVPGLQPGDIITAIKPTAQAGLAVVHAQCTALNTLELTFVCTNGTPTLTAENFLLSVVRDVYDSAAQIPSAIA